MQRGFLESRRLKRFHCIRLPKKRTNNPYFITSRCVRIFWHAPLATTACWNYFGAWEQKNVIRKIKRLVIYSAARNAPPAVTEQMMATLLNDDNLYKAPLWRIADRLGPHDPSLSLATQRAASDMCLSNYYETFHPKLATFDAGSLE